jgi:predicted RecB family nuclease
MTDRITRNIIESYLSCKYKAHLTLAGQRGTRSDYELLLAESREVVRRRATDKILGRYSADGIERDVRLTPTALKRGVTFFLNSSLEDDSLNLAFDGLQRVPGTSRLGDFHYAPVLFAVGRQVCKAQRALLDVYALLLSRLQGRLPANGMVWHGDECRETRVQLSSDPHKADRLLGELGRMQPEGAPLRLVLNDHCAVCEFRQRCHQQAVEEDNISLLRGMKEREVKAYARKGILTITQLAHTFRPRRRRRRSKNGGRAHNPALHALAIRDQKTYVFGSPQLLDAPIRVYLDLEGKPDERFVYLIGVIIADGLSESRHSFWADRPEDEPRIFEQLLRLLQPYEDFRVFCYGSYERTFLNRMRKYARRKRLVDRILTRTTNVLSIIYNHVYFPAYSNGLKEVARLLGSAWTDPDASGLQSLVWRARWEQAGEEPLKQGLLRYNLEDCTALRRVTEVLFAITANGGQAVAAAAGSVNGPSAARVEDIDALAFPRKSGSIDFVNSDFAAVNKLAYFDYQHERVYVRTSRLLRKNTARSKGRVNRKLRVSKEVFVDARRCPHCRSEAIVIATGDHAPVWPTAGKRAFDLVITPAGIRRRVIRCRTRPYRCSDCSRVFVPEAYERLDKHFHGLKSWAMHMHVGHRIGVAVVEAMFREQFGLHVDRVEIHMFKALFARYYRPTYRQLLRSLRSGNLIHADETEVSLRTGRGYIWVFTSLETVIFLFKPNREGGFLKEYLQGFRGVLVSDFYAAYDAIPCPKQKCLVHLMRDMNQLLLNHPFDDELKMVTGSFGRLLRAIVTTIDQQGLKRRYLRTHRRAASDFLGSLSERPLCSEVAEDLRQRLLRHRDELFTFLEHDGVPWNNNNAENVIRQFGYYRDRTAGTMREAGLQDYLVLLSLCHTCRYRGVSFFQFLRSGQRDLDLFCQSRRCRRFPVIQIYPKGFIPPHYSRLQKRCRTSASDKGIERVPRGDERQEAERPD